MKARFDSVLRCARRLYNESLALNNVQTWQEKMNQCAWIQSNAMQRAEHHRVSRAPSESREMENWFYRRIIACPLFEIVSLPEIPLSFDGVKEVQEPSSKLFARFLWLFHHLFLPLFLFPSLVRDDRTSVYLARIRDSWYDIGGEWRKNDPRVVKSS